MHAVRNALNKSRKKDREALAEDLKKIYRAESREKAEEALRSLRERWETKTYDLLEFLRHPKPSATTFTPPTNWNGWPRR
uniref:Mutator family transposase n=1 Tax=candidate division WOR-3 bacterium TaxID=2052148 RepID=A0A7C2P0I6_UNCW3